MPSPRRSVGRLALPVHREDAPCDRHPHDAHGGGHPDVEGPEVVGRQHETECAALHGGLNGHRAARALVVLDGFRGKVAQDAAEEVQGQARELQRQARLRDRRCALGDGRAHEEHRGDDADHGREGRDCLANLGQGLVHPDAQEDGSQHHLEGGLHDANCVDGYNSAQHELANDGRHEDAAQRRGRGHEHGERHVAACDEGAKVGRLSAVDRADEDQACEDRAVRTDELGNGEGQNRHDAVAGEEVDGDGPGPLQAGLEVVDGRGDAHTEH
mmetsp:Transcript_111955/g.316444  ORF Transcript_111955/g.316444 Transcript_111955/m.316444 type:complete len:271 (-) Transcript_111955:698-1510(-)